MLMSPFFSIIIPVYNGAQFLRKCLDSVLSQAFSDWEAICVDDGSTDVSGLILDEYAVRDTRFKIIHQKNAGVSVARQIGLDAASGEYIAWADGDDKMDSQNLAYLYNLVKVKDCDFAWTDCWEDVNGNVMYSKQDAPEDSIGYTTELLKDKIWGSLWNKVFSNSFLKKNKVIFPADDCEMMEDVCFVINAMAHNPRMAYGNEAHYYYSMRGGSLSRPRGSDELKYARWFNGERHVQEAVRQFGDRYADIMPKRIQKLAFAIYSNPNVSDEFFYDKSKGVYDINDIDVSLLHKMLYRVAARGWRGPVLDVIKAARRLKTMR